MKTALEWSIWSRQSLIIPIEGRGCLVPIYLTKIVFDLYVISLKGQRRSEENLRQRLRRGHLLNCVTWLNNYSVAATAVISMPHARYFVHRRLH